MNSYRFGLGEEPTDEMLLELMKEVAIEANESNSTVVDQTPAADTPISSSVVSVDIYIGK